MAIITESIGTGVGSAGTGNVDTVGTTAVTSGSVATAFTTELTAPGTIEIAGTLFNIASITDDDNLVTVETVPSGTNQSYNIGSRDFSTVTAWEAGNSATSSDDAVGEMYKDSDFDESVTFNDTVPLSLTLTVPSAERHTGKAATGVRMVASTKREWLVSSAAAFQIEFSWIEIDMNGNDTVSTHISCIHTPSSGGSGYTNVKNCILHDMDSGSTAVNQGFIEVVNQHASILNNICYDLRGSDGGTEAPAAVAWSGGGEIQKVQNNIVHDVDQTVSGSGTVKGYSMISTGSSGDLIQNNMATDIFHNGGGGASACYSIGAGTIDHNLATDDTDSGTGSIGADDGVLVANLYVSTVDGIEDLRVQDADADQVGVGVDLEEDPTDVNIDINGRDRHAEVDTWDMGAHQFVAAAGGVVVGKLVNGGLVNSGLIGGRLT